MVRGLDSEDKDQDSKADASDQHLDPIREKYWRAMCAISAMQSNYCMLRFQNGDIFNGSQGFLEADATEALDEGIIAVAAAAYENDIPVLSALMEKKSVIISGEDCVHANPMIIAARRGNMEAAKTILKKSEKVNFYDIRDLVGNTPLHWAAAIGDAPLVEFFLAELGDIANIPNNLTQTALTNAARFGHKDVVERLLRCEDTKRLAQDSFGTTAFWWAAWANHLEVAEVFMDQEDSLITNSKSSRSPIFAAASNGNLEMIKLLYARGKIGEDGLLEDIEQACLVEAMGNRNIELCDFFFDRKDGTGHPDEKDRAALLSRAACDRGMLKYLMNKIKFCDTELQEALVIEVCCDHLESVKNLVEVGNVDVNCGAQEAAGGDVFFRTALMTGTKSEHPAIVEYLLKRKETNPNAATKTGKTALAIAAKEGKTEIVKLLLQRDDIDVNLVDKKGRTPLARLRDGNWGRGEIEEMLRNRGAV